jgi:hypothetical protein
MPEAVAEADALGGFAVEGAIRGRFRALKTQVVISRKPLRLPREDLQHH